MIKLRKLSKWPFLNSRDNNSAYKLYVSSHGEKALKRFPSSTSFLKKPGWYSGRIGENRYFIQNSSQKPIGVVSYSANWTIDLSNKNLIFKRPFHGVLYKKELASISEVPIFSGITGRVKLAEVGIVVDPSAQKKGAATKAIELVLKELKKKGVDYVFSRTSKSNISAVNLMNKTGWVSLKEPIKDYIFFFKKID